MATARKATVCVTTWYAAYPMDRSGARPPAKSTGRIDLRPFGQHERRVQQPAQDADDKAAPTLRDTGGGKNDEDVHEGEDGIEATGEVHQQADQNQIQGQLDEGPAKQATAGCASTRRTPVRGRR